MRLTSTSNPVVPNEVRGLSRLLVFPPRWGVRALPLLLALLAAPSARAEYIVLRSGERIHVNGYQLVGDKYRLQLQGGWVDVQTADVEKIEPEEVFTPVVPDPPVPLQPIAPPYRELDRKSTRLNSSHIAV